MNTPRIIRKDSRMMTPRSIIRKQTGSISKNIERMDSMGLMTVAQEQRKESVAVNLKEIQIDRRSSNFSFNPKIEKPEVKDSDENEPLQRVRKKSTLKLSKLAKCTKHEKAQYINFLRRKTILQSSFLGKILNYKSKINVGIHEIKEEEIASALMQESPSPYLNRVVVSKEETNYVRRNLDELIKEVTSEESKFSESVTSKMTDSSMEGSFDNSEETSSPTIKTPLHRPSQQPLTVSRLETYDPVTLNQSEKNRTTLDEKRELGLPNLEGSAKKVPKISRFPYKKAEKIKSKKFLILDKSAKLKLKENQGKSTIFIDKLKQKDMYFNKIIKKMIIEGRANILEDLLSKHSIDLEKRDRNGNTYLNLASQSGNEEIIRVLVLNGALTDTQNDLGNTPLHHTFSYRFHKCMDVLVA